MEPLSIIRTVHIRASRAAVWEAITQPALISEWFGDDTDLTLEPGSPGSMTWDDYGSFRLVVEEVDEPNSLAIRWAREKDVDVTPTNSTVFRFTLEDREHGVDLTVVETGWENLEGDVAKAIQGNTEGWREELDELVAFLEEAGLGVTEALLPALAALADATRWDILTRLGREELSASALAGMLPVSRQAIAKHLVALSAAGLVEPVRRGREIRYRALGSRLSEIADELLAVGAEWDARLTRIKAIAERIDAER